MHNHKYIITNVLMDTSSQDWKMKEFQVFLKVTAWIVPMITSSLQRGRRCSHSSGRTSQWELTAGHVFLTQKPHRPEQDPLPHLHINQRSMQKASRHPAARTPLRRKTLPASEYMVLCSPPSDHSPLVRHEVTGADTRYLSVALLPPLGMPNRSTRGWVLLRRLCFAPSARRRLPGRQGRAGRVARCCSRPPPAPGMTRGFT